MSHFSEILNSKINNHNTAKIISVFKNYESFLLEYQGKNLLRKIQHHEFSQAFAFKVPFYKFFQILINHDNFM